MKYDCYPRFLKSDEYHHCWDMVDKGHQLTEMKELFLNNIGSISASVYKIFSFQMILL